MKKNYILGIIFALLNLSISGYVFAEAELTELKLGPYEAIKIDYLELSSQDLTAGKIEIRGAVSSVDEVSKIYISLDAGENWSETQGLSPFEFSFIPKEEEEYPVIVKAQGKGDEIIFSKVVIVKYISADLRNEFNDIFEEIKQAYIGERFSKFLKYFDSDEYPNFSTFEDSMESTFDDSSNFNLNISIRQVNLQKDKDKVIIKVDWDKSFETASSQSGTDNEIHFERKGGEWKITYIEDETIFTVGTGTMGGSMTNP